MLFLVEKLNYLVRSILVGAMFLTAASVLRHCMGKQMKKSGSIRFLYGFMLISEVGVLLIFLSAVICMVLPQNMFHNNWTFFSSGWYVLAGVIIPWLNLAVTGIWITGVIRKGLKIAEQNRRFRVLYRFNQPVSDPDVLDRFDQVAKRAGLKKSPLLFRNIAVTVPFLKGICNPAVVLPAGNFSQEEQVLIFAHELTHLKHRDLLFRSVAHAVFTIFWFLPMEDGWLEEIVELQESLCDIEVCRNYGKCFSAKEYFNMILEISDGQRVYGRSRNSYQVSELSESMSQLQRRIGNMSGYRYGQRRKGIFLTTMAGSGVILFLVITAGTVLPDMLILRDERVEKAGESDKIQWVAREGSFSVSDEEKNCELQWNILTSYTLEPGMQIISEAFHAAEGEKLALIVMSSAGGYEIGLKNQEKTVVIPDAQEYVSLNLELADMETCLYIRNNGKEKMEMEIYCTR